MVYLGCIVCTELRYHVTLRAVTFVIVPDHLQAIAVGSCIYFQPPVYAPSVFTKPSAVLKTVRPSSVQVACLSAPVLRSLAFARGEALHVFYFFSCCSLSIYTLTGLKTI